MTPMFKDLRDFSWFVVAIALFVGGSILGALGLHAERPLLVVLGLGLEFAGLDLLDGWMEE